jgi:hypothetical protein
MMRRRWRMTPSSMRRRRPSGQHRLSGSVLRQRSSRSVDWRRSSSPRSRRVRRSSSPRLRQSGPPTRQPRWRRNWPTRGTPTGGSLSVSLMLTTAFSSARVCAARKPLSAP